MLVGALVLVTSAFSCTQEKKNNCGYYKDVFMDSGIHMVDREDLPAVRFLGLSMETFKAAPYYPSELTITDTIIQTELMCGNPLDENGILLYPDGEPRFRMIYMNGGLATKHGNSLTPKGRENIRTFIENGGSYVGSCAGMFLASNGLYEEDKEYTPNKSYLSIWPGTTHNNWNLIKNYGRKLDLAIIECTFAFFPRIISKHHLSPQYTVEFRDKLIEIGVADSNTRFITNHFSHNGAPLHKDMEAYFLPRNIEVAYDGMVIEI